MIYTVYSESSDMTFILERTQLDEDTVQEKVVGFYFGEPNHEDTKRYNGQLAAEVFA